ncbi:hypothetical protein [Lewinella sp. 4G2]|uniref:hypothetical protein n=1 Tax=Lewinella sp. 4G2 TaxID=1803372 RepID=UPI0007B4E6F4|nr:hypothetical protein [Lewinella sp. 4G2]OAV45947.1 hypothetical protein A3850_018790 [Lewinella sp. 4G2]
MNVLKALFLALFLACGLSLHAQADRALLNDGSPVFVKVGVGLYPNISALMGELSASAGYRFNPRFGLGVEIRGSSRHNESFGNSVTVLGLHLHQQVGQRFLLGLGAGATLKAIKGSDGFTAYEYDSGGTYGAFDFAYYTRWGGTFGIYTTVAGGSNFERLQYSDATNLYEPTGELVEDGVVSAGFKVGYAFPGRRGRRE